MRCTSHLAPIVQRFCRKDPAHYCYCCTLMSAWTVWSIASFLHCAVQCCRSLISPSCMGCTLNHLAAAGIYPKVISLVKHLIPFPNQFPFLFTSTYEVIHLFGSFLNLVTAMKGGGWGSWQGGLRWDSFNYDWFRNLWLVSCVTVLYGEQILDGEMKIKTWRWPWLLDPDS